MAATEADVGDQLGWEARQRPRAAIAAFVAAVLGFGANILTTTAFSNAPHASFIAALQAAAKPGPVGSAPSQRSQFFQYYSDHGAVLVASGIAQALAYVCIAWLLTFLGAAVRARRDDFPRLVVYLGLVGGVIQAFAVVISTTGTLAAVSHFLDGPRTVDAAREVTSGSLVVTGGVLQLVGALALAAGFFLVSLNSMRTGLLTRFMGTVGIIVGVLIVIPLGPFPAVVQAFWLLTLGLLLLGIGRAGLPPAWRTGRAEPWPSAPRGAGRGAPARRQREAPDRAEPAPVARPGDARRKRKRRN